MHYYQDNKSYPNYTALFLKGLQSAIENEANGIQFYNELAKLSPNQKHKHKLYNIIEDESKHLQQLISLYSQITGTKPIYEIKNSTISSYEKGIEEAVEDEIRDYEMYRNLAVQTNNPVIQNILLQIYLDEMKHAIQLTNLRNFENKTYLTNPLSLKDYGPEPFVINIEQATEQNTTFRTALWTGKHLQLTIMNVDVEGEIGLEIHPETDQFIRIEQGDGIVMMGNEKESLNFKKNITDGDIIIIPAGKWHNVINTGTKPLKLYSIYAPPNHPRGTIHITKEDDKEH